MRQQRVEKSYVDKLDARKYLAFNLLRISSGFLKTKNIFTFPCRNCCTLFITWFLIAVRQEVKRIDGSVVAHELKLAIKRDL